MSYYDYADVSSGAIGLINTNTDVSRGARYIINAHADVSSGARCLITPMMRCLVGLNV